MASSQIPITRQLSFDMQIRLGDIIQLILILSTLIAIGVHFDSRIARVESQQTQMTQTLQTVSAEAAANSEYIKAVTELLKTFTPHVHIGRDIMYPGGKTDRLGDDRLD